MAVKWKKNAKFKPELVLDRIRAVRVRVQDGEGASFTGLDVREALPLLHSMLDFPEVARDLDKSNLIWRAAVQDPGDLTKESFLRELNRQVTNELSKKEFTYSVLTSVSITNRINLGKVTVGDAKLNYCGTAFPKRLAKARALVVANCRVPAKDSPREHTKIVATVKAKDANRALHSALRAIDLQRALWCLFCNVEMEIIGRSWLPINKIKLGAIHTIHTTLGAPVEERLWFEPHHPETDPFQPKDAAKLQLKIRTVSSRLKRCTYGNEIVDALLLYVRALDEWNQNTAFAKLWAATERLACPEHADYAAIVRRCSFLWADQEFARQTLEHLREYRNEYMHTGQEMPEAKTYCFQLQQHFRQLFFFHIGNIHRFKSLSEANSFLDQPTSIEDLKRLSQSAL